MIEIARAGTALYPPDEVAETVAFLEWLLDLNFVFLGYREYELVDLPERTRARGRARFGPRDPVEARLVGVRATGAARRRSSRTCGRGSRAATS